MFTNLKFDNKAVKKVEEDYSIIQMDQEGREIIGLIAKIYTNYIPINELAIRGFISLAVKDFQIKNSVKLTDFFALSPDLQLKYMDEIKDLVYKKISRVLLNDKQKVLLKQAIQEAVDMAKKYMDKR